MLILISTTTLGCNSSDTLFTGTNEKAATSYGNMLVDMIDKTIDNIVDPRTKSDWQKDLGKDAGLITDSSQFINPDQLNFIDSPEMACLRGEKTTARGKVGEMKGALNEVKINDKYNKAKAAFKRLPPGIQDRFNRNGLTVALSKSKYVLVLEAWDQQKGFRIDAKKDLQDSQDAFTASLDEFKGFINQLPGKQNAGVNCMKRIKE